MPLKSGKKGKNSTISTEQVLSLDNRSQKARLPKSRSKRRVERPDRDNNHHRKSQSFLSVGKQRDAANTKTNLSRVNSKSLITPAQKYGGQSPHKKAGVNSKKIKIDVNQVDTPTPHLKTAHSTVNVLTNKTKTQNKLAKLKNAEDKSIKTTVDLSEVKNMTEDPTPRSKNAASKKAKNFGDLSFRSPPRQSQIPNVEPKENYLSLASTMPPARVSAGSKSDVKNRTYMMKKKNMNAETPNKSLKHNASQRKFDTVGRKRRIEPFKSVPQAQAYDLVMQAMADFEVQFEDDSEDEENREMFGTLMKCPESE